jgi:uncharacterized protein (TIGR00369 family)
MTVRIIDLVRRARETGDLGELIQSIPYSSFLGFTAEVQDGEVIGKLTFSEHLVGNQMIPALHGGTIGALLESTAVFSVLMRVETLRVPKTISITIDYLRSGRATDTYAFAEMTKLGRRVASVRALAWQEDRSKPIAVANAHFLLLPADEDRV